VWQWKNQFNIIKTHNIEYPPSENLKAPRSVFYALGTDHKFFLKNPACESRNGLAEMIFLGFLKKKTYRQSELFSYLRELPKINIPNLLAFLVVFFVASTVT